MLITNIVSFLFIISILVLVHELGHFLAAKSIGLKVEKFYIGFNLFGLGLKKRINETEFGIGLFPLGGYVKVAGMIDESFDENYEGKDDEYISKSAMEKVWFTSGGVIFNFILAFILFSFVTYIDGYIEISDNPIIGKTIDKKPASLIGIKAGDIITEIDGISISSWSILSSIIHKNPDSLLHISWLRNGESFSDSIIVSSWTNPFGEKLGIIGVEPEFSKKKAGIITSIQKGSNQLFQWLQIMTFSIFSFFTGQLGIENFGGPIQIASIAGEASEKGFIALITLMAVLSVNLGVINILPFPGLDGGHALIAIIEGMIGRRIPFKTLMIVQQIGVLLLIIFMIIIIKNDIYRIL